MFTTTFRTATAALAGSVALLAATPAAAGVTVTTGFQDSNGAFNFILRPGQYFTLDFGAASLRTIRLENHTTGAVLSFFWVETSPGVFEVGNGTDETVLSCRISAGGNCTATDFGPVQIDLREMGGLISGAFTTGREYYDCRTPGVTPVNGAECGRLFFNIPNMLFDLTFNDVDRQLPYTLRVSDGPFPGGVPEPATWALLILGFGVVGAAQRRQRAAVRYAIG